MKNMEQLEQAYQKELKLSEKHKKAAADIKKQMECLQGKMITQKINSMSLNGAEYDKFIKLLSTGKKTLLEAADQILGEKQMEKGDVKSSEHAIP